MLISLDLFEELGKGSAGLGTGCLMPLNESWCRLRDHERRACGVEGERGEI